MERSALHRQLQSLGIEYRTFTCPGAVETVAYSKFLIDKNQFESIIVMFKLSLLFFDIDESNTPISTKILSEDFFNSAITAACEIGSTRAMWYPPNSLIPDASGSTSIAGKEGFTKYLVPAPSGGRGASRKVLDDDGKRHDRVWNDPIEIQRTVALMEAAEAAFRSPHYPKDQVDLSTKAKREQWVADSSGIWSVGTVHVQLAIARKNGLIKSGRKKK
jgi:hypothetical protein